MIKWMTRLFLVVLGLIGLVLVVAGTWFLIDVTALPRFIRDQGWIDTPVPTATLPVIRLTTTPTSIATVQLVTVKPPEVVHSPSPSQTITPTPGTTDAALVCPNTYPTQLKTGMRVYASLYPNLPSRIREQATTRAKIVGMISPGEEGDVLEGPACAEGWIWWKIKKENGLTGWTAEGDGKDYWILPKR